MTTAFVGMLRQRATYWAPLSPDGFGGSNYASPVLIQCRWQSGLSLQKIAPGQFELGSSVVYVDRPVAPKGYLALGDYTATSTPGAIAEACQITARWASPSLTANKTLYKTVVAAPNESK